MNIKELDLMDGMSYVTMTADEERVYISLTDGTGEAGKVVAVNIAELWNDPVPEVIYDQSVYKMLLIHDTIAGVAPEWNMAYSENVQIPLNQ